MKSCLTALQKISRRTWLVRILRILSAFVVGGLAGYLFYLFFGCTNGCAITSNPSLMIGYGAVSGFLIAGIPSKRKGTE